MTGLKFPILVQFVYHTGSADAVRLADYLHSALNDEPSVPGLRIPTCFIPDDGSLAPPQPELASEADRVLVVLLADDHLAAHARHPTSSGTTWAEYVVRLRDLCDSSPSHRFMPVQLTEHGWPIDPRLDDLNFLRAWTIDNLEMRQRFIVRRIIHILIRRLRPHQGGEDAPALTIFVSHTKLDFENEPRVVKSLLAHLTANQPEKTWFDSGDISAGSRFASEIERGVEDAALLAVVTDSYSSRSWCRREVLLAKRYQRPVVVVDAVQEREVRSFPYVGNVPVVRWKGEAQIVIDLLLRETLRHSYAEESLKQRKEPNDELLPAGPELVTLVHRDKNQSILYPDPPLGPEELAVIEATGIRVETPLERHARHNQLASKSLIVALSVSEAEDISRFGLRRAHLDAILLELSRYLLLSGIRLSYGGHLRADGYTIRLADLLHDPIVEQLRGKAPSQQALTPQLITYVSWPMNATVHDEAKLGSLVDVRRCERPADIDETIDPALVADPITDVQCDSPARRYGWARGLTEMRKRQLGDSSARVVIGGRIGSTEFPYKGRMPGVLEETLLSIQGHRPIYLIGAFGGCARLVFDALEGAARSELTWAHQSRIPNSEGLKQLYQERGATWEEYDGIVTFFKTCGLGGLNNGLNPEENRELGTTRSPERIVELVLAGMHQIYPAATTQDTEE